MLEDVENWKFESLSILDLEGLAEGDFLSRNP